MTATYDEHLDDGALMRAIDAGELANGASVHLANCHRCTERLETLRGRTTRLSALFQSADPADRALPVAEQRPHPRRLAPAIGIAAVLALLIATVAVPPVRALLIDGLRRVLPEQTSGPSSAAPDAVPEARPDSSAIVSFAVSGPTFQLSIEHPQQAGAVTILPGGRDLASATITGSAGKETLVVRSDGLRIVNAAASNTGYRITLPASVQEVVITLPDRAPIRLAAPATDSLIVPLNNRN